MLKVEKCNQWLDRMTGDIKMHVISLFLKLPVNNQFLLKLIHFWVLHCLITNQNITKKIKLLKMHAN